MRTGALHGSNEALTRGGAFPIAAPLIPILFGCRLHGFCSLVKPAAAPRGKVLFHPFDRLRRTEMHVGRFPAHRIDKPRLVAILRQGSELDSRAVRRQTPHHPAAME